MRRLRLAGRAHALVQTCTRDARRPRRACRQPFAHHAGRAPRRRGGSRLVGQREREPQAARGPARRGGTGSPARRARRRAPRRRADRAMSSGSGSSTQSCIAALGLGPAHAVRHLARERLEHRVAAQQQRAPHARRDGGRRRRSRRSRRARPAGSGAPPRSLACLSASSASTTRPRAAIAPTRTPGNSDFENETSCTTRPRSSSAASDGTGLPGEAQVHLVGVLDHRLAGGGGDREQLAAVRERRAWCRAGCGRWGSCRTPSRPARASARSSAARSGAAVAHRHRHRAQAERGQCAPARCGRSAPRRPPRRPTRRRGAARATMPWLAPCESDHRVGGRADPAARAGARPAPRAAPRSPCAAAVAQQRRCRPR